MNSTERSRKHREKNPGSGAQDKARERAKFNLYMFHYKRFRLYGYALPELVDQSLPVFERVKAAYEAECAEPIEVEEVCHG